MDNLCIGEGSLLSLPCQAKIFHRDSFHEEGKPNEEVTSPLSHVIVDILDFFVGKL
jgi:hypothetical protein